MLEVCLYLVNNSFTLSFPLIIHYLFFHKFQSFSGICVCVFTFRNSALRNAGYILCYILLFELTLYYWFQIYFKLLNFELLTLLLYSCLSYCKYASFSVRLSSNLIGSKWICWLMIAEVTANSQYKNSGSRVLCDSLSSMYVICNNVLQCFWVRCGRTIPWCWGWRFWSSRGTRKNKCYWLAGSDFTAWVWSLGWNTVCW